MMTHEISQYMNIMMTIVKDGGILAMDMIHDSGPKLKQDLSIITQADRAISQLARAALSDFLAQSHHILIDEEDPNLSKTLDQTLLNKTQYIWALDPIDGTRLYANCMPLFGISIGLMKDLKPWLGVVYFPMLNELFYCDGTDAYFVQHPFSEHEKKTIINPNTEEISEKSLFFCNDTFFNKFDWKDKDFHILIHACAVVNLCWPTIGRGIGCFQRCYIWDFAGSWPIIQKAGFDLRRMTDGKLMEHLDCSLFTQSPRPWQMKDYYLISTQSHYELIKSKIIHRP